MLIAWSQCDRGRQHAVAAAAAVAHTRARMALEIVSPL